VLVDTNTLLRTLQPLHPQRELTRSAIKALTARGHELQLVPQNLIELWVVATRPVAQNGLGLSISEAMSELMRLKSMFPLLPQNGVIGLRKRLNAFSAEPPGSICSERARTRSRTR
jgi:hypothetical protein